MKKIITLFAAAFITGIALAHVGGAPEMLSYQTVIRNASNALVVNQAVGIRISILQGSTSGTAVYVETQTDTTNINGLASLEIGNGTPVTGTFAGIDWSAGPYWVETETDPTGGTNYTITGTSQLLSVPYALYAATAGGGYWAADNSGDIYNLNSNYVGIGTNTPQYNLDITGAGGPRFRISSQGGSFAGMLAQNNDHQYFCGIQGTYESASGTSSGFHIYDNTAGARRMVIDTAGNMGVGTSSPYNRLDVGGAMAIGSYGGATLAPANGLIVSGNVGIGTSTAAEALEVNGSIRLSNGGARTLYVPDATGGVSGNDLTIQAGGTPWNGSAAAGGNLNLTAGNVNSANHANAGGNVIITSGGNPWLGQGVNGDIIFQSDSATESGVTISALAERMRINGTSGYVGIGTNAPTDLLSVNGPANNTTGSWGVFSDARIKTVTGDFTDGLDVISRMHTVKFNYNADAPFGEKTQQIGVIAQELEKIAPYMVTQKEYKQFKDLREVNNQAYVFLLINAVKQLNTLVKTQQATIDAQQAESNNFKSDINKLKASIENLQEIVGGKAEK